MPIVRTGSRVKRQIWLVFSTVVAVIGWAAALGEVDEPGDPWGLAGLLAFCALPALTAPWRRAFLAANVLLGVAMTLAGVLVLVGALIPVLLVPAVGAWAVVFTTKAERHPKG